MKITALRSAWIALAVLFLTSGCSPSEAPTGSGAGRRDASGSTPSDSFRAPDATLDAAARRFSDGAVGDDATLDDGVAAQFAEPELPSPLTTDGRSDVSSMEAAEQDAAADLGSLPAGAKIGDADGAPAEMPRTTGGASAGADAWHADPHGRRPDRDGEDYDSVGETGFTPARARPLSTFSIDVDTAAYANVRRFLRDGALPPPEAVRVEEMINYFDYDYPEPRGEHPLAIYADQMAAPWAPDHRLVRIGVKARSYAGDDRPRANLVFLIDVSGSMDDERKLPLLKDAMQRLVTTLRSDDTVAIVTYAGWSGIALDPTPARQRDEILGVIDQLQPGGSTNGAAGIEDAYRLARRAYVDGGVNRVILATDGDFNVGITDAEELTRIIEAHSADRIFLSVLGFGVGNLKDARLEDLADRGNGNYAYIDTSAEARKVLVREVSSTLYTVAKDVKIQVEFDPAEVEAYRLIGYENRRLADHEFLDDTKDAGEMGAGHRVTALYELVTARHYAPPGGLRYGRRSSDRQASNELMTVMVRYKEPEGWRSKGLERSVTANTEGSGDLSFAAAVAAFGLILSDSEFRGDADLDMVRELAYAGRGDDEFAYRAEFIAMVEAADRHGLAAAGGFWGPGHGYRHPVEPDDSDPGGRRAPGLP